jgi:hypothetical protein
MTNEPTSRIEREGARRHRDNVVNINFSFSPGFSLGGSGRTNATVLAVLPVAKALRWNENR